MKKTPKKKTPSIDEISDMAAEGKDVSKYFTKKFRVRQPLEKAQIQRVNLDFNLEMLEELDALAKESATTSRAGGMGMAPRRGRDHALLVVADL